MSTEFKMFLQLVYSFAKQYIAWYETNMKAPKVYNTVTEVKG